MTKSALANFHVRCAELAKNAINVLSSHERDITGMTVGISQEGLEKIRKEISATRARIAEIATSDNHADRVYQINFHVFPMSEPLSKGKAEK